MARTRLLHPEFFLNEDLGHLSPIHAILFAGLWTLADREGRLEDRPGRIKLQVLPWWKADVNALLLDLHRSGFIQRYVAAGECFIAIPKFLKHQNPHLKEKPSMIPAPPSLGGDKPGTSTELAPDKPGTSTGQEQCKPGDQIRSVSDPVTDTVSKALLSTSVDPPAPEDQLVDLWNATAAPEMPRCEQLTPARRQKAKALLKVIPLERWPDLIAIGNASDFCRGIGKDWKLSLAWMLKSPENALKVLEGTYANGVRKVRDGYYRPQDMTNRPPAGEVKL